MSDELLELWKENQLFNAITGKLTRHPGYRTMLYGLDSGARAFLMAALATECRRPSLVVVPDINRLEKMYANLSVFSSVPVRMLPSREFFLNTEVLSRSEEYQQMRLQFLEWVTSNQEGVYVTTASAMQSRMLPVSIWHELTMNLQPGQKVDRQELIGQLTDMGYKRVSLTETRGQFSARGEIIDIYPTGYVLPFRLDLFDDTIQTLRFFDPATQRSTDYASTVTVSPARELVLPEKYYRNGVKHVWQMLEQAVTRLQRRGEKERAAKLKSEVERHLERLAYPEGLDYLSGYFPFFYGEGNSLFDYLSPEFLVFVEDPAAVAEAAVNFRQELENHFNNSPVERELLKTPDQLVWHKNELFPGIPCPLVSCSLFQGTGGLFKPKEAFNLESTTIPYYHGQWDLFKTDYREWLRKDYRVYLVSPSIQRGRGLLDQLAQQGVFSEESAPGNGGGYNYELARPQVLEGSLDEGLVFPDLRLVVISEQNLLPRRRKKKRLKSQEGIRLSDYRELSAGDYVVHEQHGIGKYQGIRTLEIGSVERDYLLLKYKETDKLYIPVEQINLIQKYSGKESPPPQLHKLGGNEWPRLKKKVSQSVEELARELLSLYAARQASTGYSFGPEHPWQQEFETHFPYEETPDQLQAIQEVKADLEKQYPMDRLVCGDVGYGKTEVAMRAAFKVVMEGKQVAILVPTTVLAQQHYRTFQERFEGFPVRVAQLSRFIAKPEQRTILKDLAAGKIDIIIGTHRLLSEDIGFNDLGLFVLDEEQRFGVRQKEKLKKLRLEVDTLAMTATPIPRTLHLSLARARDLSVIDSPPEDRYPVQTYVLEYSDDLVKEAVQRELNRDGQAFIVFNRVDHIDAFANRIQKMFPHVPVAVAHGQMSEATLGNIMVDFQDGKYQILVCTTIIESGLDIPNVNTLIVYEADKFGLAQLYQIRGRVGRSNRLAYAYLTYRKDKVVSETAQKRLKAVKEFTELGSGFKIALRDLEIRGAGNILGAEQHGFIAAVGFDLYCKLLDRAVAELKNEKPVKKIDPRLEIQVSAYLPSSYIADQGQKIDFYQRIYNARNREELREIEEEMVDRFGPSPAAVNNLLAIAELRIIAIELGVESIRQQKDVLIQFAPGMAIDSRILKDILTIEEERITIRSKKPLCLKIKSSFNREDRLLELTSFFEELIALQPTFSNKSR
ncbi:MAG: transcription-repair coupling factor [Bacillota bacterium]